MSYIKRFIRYLIKIYHILRYGHALPSDYSELFCWLDFSDPEMINEGEVTEDGGRIYNVKNKSTGLFNTFILRGESILEFVAMGGLTIKQENEVIEYLAEKHDIDLG